MNRFSICEAYFAFAHDWNGSACFGIPLEIRRIPGRLHAIGFHARPTLGGFETLDPEEDPESIDAYMALLDRHGLREEFERQQRESLAV